MTGMPTRSRVSTSQAPAVIIDGRLALSTYGLLVSMRFADWATVWLARALWSLLDNDQFFQERPELIDDIGEGSQEAAMLAEWRRAWLQANLLDRFCWIGDARHESLLPFDMPDGSVERFELLSGLLDGRGAGRFDQSPLGECARDAACLAAILSPTGAVILTIAEASGAEPRLCAMLKAAGVDCMPVSDAKLAADASADLLPGKLHTFARQLALNKFCLAAVHLLAPRALVPILADDEDLEWQAGYQADDADPWADSSASWHLIG